MTTYKITPQRCKLVRDGAAIPSPVERVSCAEDAVRFFRDYYDREALPHERIVMLLLNGRNRIVALVRVADGGVSGCALTPKDVLRAAVVANASAIVLAHNHPSGDPTPSREDVELTRQLAAACDTVGIALLDHVIVGAGYGETPSRASSMLELGLVASC